MTIFQAGATVQCPFANSFVFGKLEIQRDQASSSEVHRKWGRPGRFVTLGSGGLSSHLCPLLRYEEELALRATAENEFVLLKKVSDSDLWGGAPSWMPEIGYWVSSCVPISLSPWQMTVDWFGCRSHLGPRVAIQTVLMRLEEKNLKNLMMLVCL